MKKSGWLIISFLLLSSLLCNVGIQDASGGTTINTIDYRSLINEINRTRVYEHVRFFTELGSRVIGYPSYYEAVKYVRHIFNESGLSDIRYENFTAAAPISLGASIEVLEPVNEKFEAYPLWPNSVSLNIINTTASLIYAKDGSLEYFDGLEVKGSIVLMEFNSLWRWRNAMMLGAKAVIFIEPEDTNAVETLQKISHAPVKFPRLYVDRDTGEHLKTLIQHYGSLKVHISSKMIWKAVDAVNVIGRLYGVDPILSKEVIVIASYLDSWSIVPSVNPGATDALGAACILELARIFAKNPPPRTVEFILFSGHYRALEGARFWVDRNFDHLRSVKYFISLDLSAGTSDLALYARGSTYSYKTPVENLFFEIQSKFFRSYLPAMESQLGKKYSFIDAIYWAYPVAVTVFEPLPILLESDPVTAACYGGGVGFHTTNDLRKFQRSPIDELERINFNNLWPQLEIITGMMFSLAHEPRLSQFNNPSRFGVEKGSTALTVCVAKYNVTSAWFQPFIHNDSLIEVTIFSFTTDEMNQIEEILSSEWARLKVSAGVSITEAATGTSASLATGMQVIPPLALTYIIKPDSNGFAKIPGLKPHSVLFIQAYVVNSTTGNIEYATDLGAFGSPGFPHTTKDKRMVQVIAPNPFKYAALFPCGSIVLSSIIDPRSLAAAGTIDVLNAISHNPDIHYGYALSLPDVVAFVFPESPVEIVMSGTGGLMGVLTNATSAQPEGNGYQVLQGESYYIENTPFKVVENMHLITTSRMNILNSYKVLNPDVIRYSQYSEEYLSLANIALQGKEYKDAYSFLLLAWGFELRYYSSVMDLIMNVITTLVFFSVMLVPFSLLIERLFMSRTGSKRMMSITIIFVFMNVIMFLVHPGFHIAFSVPMVLIGVTLASFCGIIIAQSFSGASELASRMREQISGFHFERQSRTSSLALAFSFGVRQMKKRKIRSALTMFSLIVIVFSMITFTSISNITIFFPSKFSRYVPYQGILMRNVPWEPLSEEAIDKFISGLFKNRTYSLRGWIYPPKQEYFLTSNRAPELRISSILAMSPQDYELLRLESIMVKGRWFEPNDFYSILLPSSLVSALSEELGNPVTIGSKIPLWGLNLTVIGIFDGDLLTSIKDLDDEPITPADYVALSNVMGAQAVEVPHLNGRNVVIVPISLARSVFHAPIMSIAVSFPKENKILDTAQTFSLAFKVPVFASTGTPGEMGTVSLILPRSWLSAEGIQFFIVPFIICFITVLNLMLGAVQDRLREIPIYSALGLSPTHISGLFLTEALVFAIVSGVIGYIAGVVGIRVILEAGMAQEGFYPNYTSLFVIFSISISALATIVSTLYPSLVVAKLSAPSMERKWKMPTKPRGTLWHIPLPFTERADMVQAIIYFLKEFLDLHRTEHVGTFWASDISISESQTDDGHQVILKAMIRLAPFDTGLAQIMELRGFVPKGEDLCRLTIDLKRTGGPEYAWYSSNYLFINEIRRQLLLWRTLPEEKRRKYAQEYAEKVKNKN